jgi:hypothetical protein
VDNDDLKCLTNVVGKKWWGDFNGGVCFDATYDSPLKGDLSGDKFVKDDDEALLKKILKATGYGIEMPPLVLGAVDFNQDEKITQQDVTCLDYFLGMELAKPETMLAAGQTIPADCMNIYHLDECKDIRGDLNGDLRIDSMDEILIMLANAKQITGYDAACADVNKDNRITLEDVACVKDYTEGNRDQFFACIGCTDNTPPGYRQLEEVCGDGYDNNCDGLVDKTSTNALTDLCGCTDQTECWRVVDADGGTVPGVDDGNVKVCRKVEWGAGSEEATGGNAVSGYQWMAPSALACTKDRECKSMLCADTVYKCAYGAHGWKWYDTEVGLPVETDSPGATPKTCADTFDNDCNCGDRACATTEGGSMFKSGSFWIGAALGITAGLLTGGTALPLIMSLGSTVGGFVTDDPQLKAGLAGFGIGVAVGGWFRGTTAGGYKNPAGEKYLGGATSDKPFLQGSLTRLQSLPANPAWYQSATTGWQVALGASALGAMMSMGDYKEKTAKWVHTANCGG